MKMKNFSILIRKKARDAVQIVQKSIKGFTDLLTTVPHHLNSFWKKAKGLFQKWKYNVNAFIDWKANSFRNRYSIPLDNFCRIFKTILLISVVLGSFIYILIASKVILLTENGVPCLNRDFTSEYITKSGILGSQITFVLICVSLIALVSSIDQKYIYGEKLIHLAFAKYGMCSFGMSMMVLFSLLIFNVIQMFQKKAFAAVVIVYLITMYLALIILYRFSSVFLNQYSVKKRLRNKYYHSNITHMQKDKPHTHYTSTLLMTLKNMSIKHIIEKNIAALSDNLVLYFSLIGHTLNNRAKLAQEYHTEINSGDDIIGHVNELALTMLKHGNAEYGLQTYVELLKKLNYYKITTVADMSLSSAPYSFIEALTSFNNKSQLSRYLNLILKMNAELIEQVYLFATEDLSYCRLAKHQLLHSYIVADMYEKTYDQLQKIPYLSTEDRFELINQIRMSIITLYTTEQLRVNCDCHKTWRPQPITKRNYPLDIRSEPVARYLLRLIETSDAEHLKYFYFMFHDATNKHNDEAYAKILSIISVVNMLYHENKRMYVADLNIDEDSTKKLFKKLKYLDCPLSNAQAELYYNFTVHHYVEDEPTSREASGGFYSFSRLFTFDGIVVDTVFACLIWANNSKNNLDTITSQFNLRFDKKTYCILKELGVALPENCNS